MKPERLKSMACRIYIGMTRPPSDQDLDDVRSAVIESGAPLMQVAGEKGGKYGFYMMLLFEQGWCDVEKMADISKFLQIEFGKLEG